MLVYPGQRRKAEQGKPSSCGGSPRSRDNVAECPMFNTPSAYLNNSILRWLYAHGWEEPVGPLGPLVSQYGPSPEPWRAGPAAGPRPEPWHVAVGQLVQAVQVKDF